MATDRARPSATDAVVTVNEAAFVAGVSVRTVNRAIDREHIRTRVLRRKADRARRGVGATDILFLRVHSVLAPAYRSRLYKELRGKSLEDIPRTYQRESVVLDLEDSIRGIQQRLGVLQGMKERIESDPEIRSGEPVFRGTRERIPARVNKS